MLSNVAPVILDLPIGEPKNAPSGVLFCGGCVALRGCVILCSIRYHTRCYHTPKHTVWVFGRAFTPPLHHPPSFITPTLNHTLWMFARPITPPRLSHTPWAPCELHFITRGPQDITPPQDTTPGDHIVKSQNFMTGVCCLV